MEGVCKRSQHEAPHCHIFPVFLFSNILQEERVGLESADDHVFLEEVRAIPPNKRDISVWGTNHWHWLEAEAKTAKWFKYAFENYPWATHVFKFDTDAMLFVPLFLDDMFNVRAKYLYYGKQSHNRMMGECYGMTRDLVSCWLPFADSEAAARMYAGGPEDGVTARMVCEAAKAGKCPDSVLWM